MSAPSLDIGRPNAALEAVKDEDLTARYPSQVRQPAGSDRRPGGAQRPQLYPGTEAAAKIGMASGSGTQRPAVSRSGEGYQLNFDNAGIADVAKAILGDTLQVPYIIDSRVQGQMTLATGRAVSRNDLLKSFEVALKLSNAVLLADGAGYRILPAGEAAAGDVGRLDPVRSGETIPAGYGVSVMPLRNTSVDAMLRLLDGFLARAGSVKAEQTGNLLIIRGGARERESIIDVISTFDVDWLRGQSAGIFPLSHATPDEMITELNQVLQNEPGNLNANMVRFQPVTRLNAVLVLARTPSTLPTVAEWVRRLDKASTEGQSVHVYQVENGKAADIAQILNDTFNGTGAVTRRTARTDVAPGRDAASLSSAGSTGLGRTAAQPAAAAPAPAALARPATSATGTGAGGGAGALDARIIADESNNALLIRASQADYQKILATLRQLDKPPLQVLINATIAEVTLNDALRYGVQVYLKNSNKGSVGYHPGPSDLALQPKFPGLNMILGNIADPRVVLDALADVTTVKVVSSPSVVVIDNQPATLKVGDEVPISTQQSQSTENPNAPVINSIRFRETGVILKVTPRVNSSGLVTMDVEQEISQVAGNADGSTTATLTPTISQRRIASTVAVYSGQTVTLGGLISEQQNRGQKSVPLFNRIPILGDLVGKTEKENKRTELIVFIKPQIIRNGEDASRVSEELRSKLKSMAFEPQPVDPYRRGNVASKTQSIKDR